MHAEEGIGSVLLPREKEETLYRDVDFDFDVYRLSINYLPLDTFFFLWRKLQDGISLEIVIRPRAG